MAGKEWYFGKNKDANIYIGVRWTDWALPLNIHADPRRPWPMLTITIGPFYFGFEFWRGES